MCGALEAGKKTLDVLDSPMCGEELSQFLPQSKTCSISRALCLS